MAEEAKAPQQDAPAPEQPHSIPSILTKIIGQKEHDFISLEKTRIADYEFKGEYDANFPKKCKIRRWPYGASITLLPRTIGVIGEVLNQIVSLSPTRTLDMELSGKSVDSVFDVLSSKAKVVEYTSILKEIGGIINDTLKLEKDQSIPLEELELVDIIGISKVILGQNLGVVLKNLLAAPEKEPQKSKEENKD